VRTERLRIVFIADARSPIAVGWIKHFIDRGHDVHILSTYPCPYNILPGAKVYQVPIAFSQFAKLNHNGTIGSASRPSVLTRGLAHLRTGRLSGLITNARNWLSPIELNWHVKEVRNLIAEISPDIVHAMRIPFEGMLAMKSTPLEIPLIVSVWGNDFTLFANQNPLMARETRRTMARADALQCDCQRDLQLASRDWGFHSKKLAIVIPSSGGIQSSLFHAGEPAMAIRDELNIPSHAPVIINPRGFRTYVRNDVFFQAIPHVLKLYPKAIFICTGMQANPVAEKWVDDAGIKENVRLLPLVPRDQMADLFRLTCVAVSPSLHDGTPNTLLETMACGSFPVAFDIESVREWITDEVNGLLCDPNDPALLARAIIRALKDEQLRNSARAHNLGLIAERAEYDNVMRQGEEFYLQIIRRKQQAPRVN
jgi:glycosyltransferase involved in cell wall biosynthesis